MKYLIITLSAAVAMLSGCASMQYAGTASYSVKPFTDKAGNVACCEVAVNNGKEIANLEAHIVKTPDGGYTVDLKEQGVAAFQGQAIAAGATKEAIADAAKIGVAAALAPVLPALLPAAGAALASPGLGAAAAGAAGVIGVQKLTTPAP